MYRKTIYCTRPRAGSYHITNPVAVSDFHISLCQFSDPDVIVDANVRWWRCIAVSENRPRSKSNVTIASIINLTDRTIQSYSQGAQIEPLRTDPCRFVWFEVSISPHSDTLRKY
jgi:hypothetical protein